MMMIPVPSILLPRSLATMKTLIGGREANDQLFTGMKGE